MTTQINNPQGNYADFSHRPIYGKFSLVLLAIIIVTLLPHYGKIFDNNIHVNIDIILHGSLYLGWYILFAVQTTMSAMQKVSIHKKIGLFSLLLVSTLFFSGTDLLINIMRSYDASWSADYIRYRTSFVWAIFHTMVSFMAFYICGIAFRKNLHAHKRFMLLASLSMISASITRVAFLPFIPVDGMAVTLLSTYGLLLVPIIIDKVVFGRIHIILKLGVPVYIVTQILCIGILPSTSIGQSLAFPF